MDITKLCEKVIQEAMEDDQELIPTPNLPSVLVLVEREKVTQELLEALQQVARMIKWAEDNTDSPKSALSHFIEFEPYIKEAIAKATGKE
jgi:hypothetical protein